MSVWLQLALLFLPAAFWIGYAYYHDRFKPEPPILTIFSYFLGFAAGWLCLRTYDVLLPALGLPIDLDPIGGLNLKFFLYCVLVVGLVEETFKFIPFLLITRFSHFNEELDGLFYAATIALGFAAFENMQYLPCLSGFELFGRAVASPLSHSVFAAIWGHLVGCARIRKKGMVPAATLGLGLAALAHGLFNFLNFSPILRFLSALLVLALWLWRIRTAEHLARKCV
ncbi:MAG: PrsW family intramembrane metalloprotease [Candidatus Aminicenantes bacterium]|nr:PrsW family intramembrane metalloprotease [Candidatus Aminicenantes bacterium]